MSQEKPQKGLTKRGFVGATGLRKAGRDPYMMVQPLVKTFLKSRLHRRA